MKLNTSFILFLLSFSIFAQKQVNNISIVTESKIVTENSFTINQSISTAPKYYDLLFDEHPNIKKITEAYQDYYRSNAWKKNNYTRAYRSFLRAYDAESFDENGDVIIPKAAEKIFAKKQFAKKRAAKKANSFGSEWKAIPVRIERSDCYYTGQNGVIRSLAVHPTNPNIVIAGGMAGGAWKSTDKGKTWSESVLKGLPFVDGMINKIVFAPSNPNYVYMATNAGILKSTDGGNNFAITSIDYTGSFPNIDRGGDGYRSHYMYVDVSPIDENTLIASDINPSDLQTNIVMSRDGGATWGAPYLFGKKNFPIDLKYHPTDPQIVYTLILEAGQIKFYRSSDGGVSFKEVTLGFPEYLNTDKKLIRAKIGLTPAQPNLVAFYLNVTDHGAAFYKSINSGISFERACCGPATPVVNKSNGKRDYFGEGFSAIQIWWATTIAISDVDPNFVAAATNVQPRFSMDQMASWYWTGEQKDVGARPRNVLDPKRSCGTTLHGDIQDMIIRGDDVWVANDGGIALSENRGVTFEERADGIPITMALGFDMLPGKKDVIVAALDHNGVIVRDESVYGEYWKPLGGGDASGASINPGNDSWLYARPSGDEIIERPSQGPSHGRPAYQGTALNFGSGYRNRYNNVQFHPNEYYTLFSVDYEGLKVQKSTDNGKNWTAIKDLLPDNNGWSYAEVKVSNSNPETLYVSNDSQGENTLDRSNDAGKTWKSILPSILTDKDRIRNIEIDSQNHNIIWISVNGDFPKIYKSIDGGETWENYSTGLSKYRIYSMIHQKGSNGGLYIGTRYGVYYRDNNRAIWEQFGTEIPGVKINFLKINYAKGLIRAATIRGIWENELATQNAPLAQISVNKANSSSCGGVPLNFVSLSAVSADNETTFQWEFEGGTPSFSNEERPSVLYSNQGTYDVKLTVTDSNGTNASSLKDFITINNNSTISCSNLDSDQDGIPNFIEGRLFSSDIDNDGLLNIFDLDSDGDGISDADEYTSCNRTVPQSAAFKPGDSMLAVDLGSANSNDNKYYVNLSAWTSCYNATTTLKAEVDVANNKIKVISYRHFRSEKDSRFLGDETNVITSIDESFAKIKYVLEGNKIYLHHINNACGSTGTLRSNLSCWNPLATCDKTGALPDYAYALDATISSFNGALSANISGATYQWIDCDANNQPINGATGQSFIPSKSGNYAVIISDQELSNCKNTSKCARFEDGSLSISNTLVDEKKHRYSLYPNPIKHSFTLEGVQLNDHIIITDLRGRNVHKAMINSSLTKAVFDVTDFDRGIYFLRVNEGPVFKILVQN